jgi:hypothetical protein
VYKEINSRSRKGVFLEESSSSGSQIFLGIHLLVYHREAELKEPADAEVKWCELRTVCALTVSRRSASENGKTIAQGIARLLSFTPDERKTTEANL